MRTLMISVFIIMMCIPVYANDIFLDTDLRDLQVVEVSKDEGYAWVRNMDGIEAEVIVGDTIGSTGGIVTNIGGASITVQVGNIKTRIPVTYEPDSVQTSEMDSEGDSPLLYSD